MLHVVICIVFEFFCTLVHVVSFFLLITIVIIFGVSISNPRSHAGCLRPWRPAWPPS